MTIPYVINVNIEVFGHKAYKLSYKFWPIRPTSYRIGIHIGIKYYLH